MSKDSKKDYKDTLILPKTDFPMRANLPQKEGDRYKKWQNDINGNSAYSIMSRDRGSDSFNLHDGPPYANGHLHVGHALNKILKDFIVKLHYFNGKQVFFTPGWDCHGLPIEQQVSNDFESKKHNPTKLETRAACRAHAAKFIDIQKEEFLSLGIVGDFDNPYKTMDYKFEANIYRALVKIANKGLLKQRSKPIFWSWAARSALAEAEVEYKDKKSDSIFVSFKLDSDSAKSLEIENLNPYMIIWTTTPWTLPSNVAIALHPDEIYVVLDSGAIVAKKLYENLIEKGIVKGKIVKEIESKKLEKCYAINPLNNRKSLIILASYVSMEDGTGAVHNAPGHGEDDYFACLKYDLDVIMPVSDSGLFDENVEKQKLLGENSKEFVGIHIFKAQKIIIDMLRNSNALISHSEITHSYPHCWRTNKPIIFRATKQWFILMDKPYHNGKTLREVALSEIEKTRFYPANGINRIKSMVENRPDWCISRQREWGVPLAFFIDKESGEPLLDSEVTTHIANLFEKDGCDIWWDKDIADLLPNTYKDKANNYTKNMHILDVWFDSGSTWYAVLNGDFNDNMESSYKSGFYPASMYLEGSDQHRGWFQSSLLISCAINNKASFKSIITHGFTLDEKNDKMSKSKGNVLAPSAIIKQYGSEIMRLWVALSDYQSDVKISQNILKQISDNYLKLRNTIRFLLANTQGLERLHLENLSPIDVWILKEAKGVFLEIDKLFKEYDFSKGFQLLNGFITANLSGIYLDISKDSLYCDRLDSKKRLAIQSVFALLANKILHLLAPFLTYTIDEALEYAGRVIKGNANSVFMLELIEFPNLDSYKGYDDFRFLLDIRAMFNEQVDKLKKDKVINSSLELEIFVSNAICETSLISDFIMVSNASLMDSKGDREILFSLNVGDIKIDVARAVLAKCPRCWQYKVADSSEICHRCSEIVG